MYACRCDNITRGSLDLVGCDRGILWSLDVVRDAWCMYGKVWWISRGNWWYGLRCGGDCGAGSSSWGTGRLPG